MPAVTADEMREVDRVAVEEFGLSILQMMENAGRNLADHALQVLGAHEGEVTILAGAGGNGGGACAVPGTCTTGGTSFRWCSTGMWQRSADQQATNWRSCRQRACGLLSWLQPGLRSSKQTSSSMH